MIMIGTSGSPDYLQDTGDRRYWEASCDGPHEVVHTQYFSEDEGDGDLPESEPAPAEHQPDEIE